MRHLPVLTYWQQRRTLKLKRRNHGPIDMSLSANGVASSR